MYNDTTSFTGMSRNVETVVPADQGKGQGYSAKEAQLIRELVQARMEQNNELEYENFDGYEIPPRTQFSMLNKPAVSIKYGQMTFNKACIRLFEGVRYILTPINSVKKRLAVICCTEEEGASVEWAKKKKNDTWESKTISSVEVCEKLYRLMGWDRNCRYKVLGRIANSDRGLVLLFDLEEAIMFTPQPEEYVDKKTGAVKKRRVSYYPDMYKDRIGRSYNDYAAAQQMSMFEPLDDYTGKTYGDAPESEAIPRKGTTAIIQPMVTGLGG